MKMRFGRHLTAADSNQVLNILNSLVDMPNVVLHGSFEIRRLWARNLLNGSVAKYQRRGRPKKTSHADDKIMLNVVRSARIHSAKADTWSILVLSGTIVQQPACQIVNHITGYIYVFFLK